MLQTKFKMYQLSVSTFRSSSPFSKAYKPGKHLQIESLSRGYELSPSEVCHKINEYSWSLQAEVFNWSKPCSLFNLYPTQKALTLVITILPKVKSLQQSS